MAVAWMTLVETDRRRDGWAQVGRLVDTEQEAIEQGGERRGRIRALLVRLPYNRGKLWPQGAGDDETAPASWSGQRAKFEVYSADERWDTFHAMSALAVSRGTEAAQLRRELRRARLELQRLKADRGAQRVNGRQGPELPGTETVVIDSNAPGL
jgi:hypothetical protein